jgi:hypothetical protein
MEQILPPHLIPSRIHRIISSSSSENSLPLPLLKPPPLISILLFSRRCSLNRTKKQFYLHSYILFFIFPREPFFACHFDHRRTKSHPIPIIRRLFLVSFKIYYKIFHRAILVPNSKPLTHPRRRLPVDGGQLIVAKNGFL